MKQLEIEEIFMYAALYTQEVIKSELTLVIKGVNDRLSRRISCMNCVFRIFQSFFNDWVLSLRPKVVVGYFSTGVRHKGILINSLYEMITSTRFAHCIHNND